MQEQHKIQEVAGRTLDCGPEVMPPHPISRIPWPLGPGASADPRLSRGFLDSQSRRCGRHMQESRAQTQAKGARHSERGVEGRKGQGRRGPKAKMAGVSGRGLRHTGEPGLSEVETRVLRSTSDTENQKVPKESGIRSGGPDGGTPEGQAHKPSGHTKFH